MADVCSILTGVGRGWVGWMRVHGSFLCTIHIDVGGGVGMGCMVGL